MANYFKSVLLKQGEAYYDEVSDASIGIHHIEYVNEIAKAVLNLPAAERKNIDVEIKAGSLWKYQNGGKNYVLHVAAFKGAVKEETPCFKIEVREVE